MWGAKERKKESINLGAHVMLTHISITKMKSGVVGPVANILVEIVLVSSY